VGREGLTFSSYSGGTFGSGTHNQTTYLGPYSSSGQAQYYSRIAFGTGSGYVLNGARKSGWVELKTEIGTHYDETVVRFFVDNANPVTRSAAVVTWNSLQLGPVAGTALRTVYFDDITVETVTPAVPVSMSGLWIE